MANIPVGLQLYTLREETANDFRGTLEKVAGLGYRAVEFAGYGDIPAKEMKSLLDGLGLEAVSSHVGMHLLESELEKQIEYSLEIGAKYIMVPWIDVNQLKGEQYPAFVAKLKQIGEECNRHGLQLGYHNHDFEFELVDGEPILDRLFRDVPDSLLQAELDLYWVTKAGYDPKSYVLKYKDRCPVLHVKDMTKDERKFFAEVGQGSIDFKAIFDIAEEAGVRYYIVEQDACERPPLESVRMSIEYLKSIGIA